MKPVSLTPYMPIIVQTFSDGNDEILHWGKINAGSKVSADSMTPYYSQEEIGVSRRRLMSQNESRTKTQKA
jgi:hypothetical protein